MLQQLQACSSSHCTGRSMGLGLEDGLSRPFSKPFETLAMAWESKFQAITGRQERQACAHKSQKGVTRIMP